MWGGCGPGQLNLSGGRKNRSKIPCNGPFTNLAWSADFRKEKYPRTKIEGKTNWDNNNLVMLSHYPVLEDTYFHPSYLAVSKGTYCTF